MASAAYWRHRETRELLALVSDPAADQVKELGVAVFMGRALIAGVGSDEGDEVAVGAADTDALGVGVALSGDAAVLSWGVRVDPPAEEFRRSTAGASLRPCR